MSSTAFLHAATRTLTRELPHLYRDFIRDVKAEDIEEIINVHAMGAAAAGLASGWIPGGGGVAASVAAVGFIWSMYYRINKKIGLPMSKNILKSLGAAVLANISGAAMSLAGGIALATALSFTGIGNVAASIIMAGLDYAIVLVSGVIYLKLLVGLFKAGKDPQRMTADDLNKAAANVMKQEDVGQMFKEAQSAYKQARKSGEATGKESVELEND